LRSAYIGESTGSLRSWSRRREPSKAFERFDHGAEILESAGAVKESGVTVTRQIDIPGEESEDRRQRLGVLAYFEPRFGPGPRPRKFRRSRSFAAHGSERGSVNRSAVSTAAGKGNCGANRYRTEITFVPVNAAIECSLSEIPSRLVKPPPMQADQNAVPLLRRKTLRVTTHTFTPPNVVSSISTGMWPASFP